MSDVPKIAKSVALFLGPVLFGLIHLIPLEFLKLSSEGRSLLALLVWMVFWWVTEAIPIAVTALFPIFLYPLLGILPAKDVAAPYAHPVLFLLMGGFLIALAMQKCRLKERLAVTVILKVGTKPAALLFAFMAVTAFGSMWISNTATTMMMLPIAISVIGAFGGEKKEFALVLFLAIAYSASVGGMATPIGTPPNMILMGIYGEMFPDAPPISFLKWMTAALPVSVIMLCIIWLYFLLRIRKSLPLLEVPSREIFRAQKEKLGPMSNAEKRVALIGVMTILLWITRSDIAFGGWQLKGWSSVLPWGSFVDDGTVAMFSAILLFILPADWKKGERLLDWRWALKLPWDVMILLGGGFALARGFEATGLDGWFGALFAVFGKMNPVFMVFFIALFMIFLTEISSNTAITATVLPILAGLASAIDVHPLVLMLPAAYAVSCAFMLPMATAPNAIVFGSGYIRIPEMARIGFVLNIVGAIIVTILTFLIAYPVFNIEGF